MSCMTSSTSRMGMQVAKSNAAPLAPHCNARARGPVAHMAAASPSLPRRMFGSGVKSQRVLRRAKAHGAINAVPLNNDRFANASSPNIVQELVRLPRADGGKPIDVNILRNSKVEAKGVVLFLHGFEQYPQDYATVLCGLAEEGLNIVAPVMSRASGDLNLVMPAKLQAADLEDVKTVIKALFDKNSNTLRKYVPKASPNRVVALAGHSLGGGLTMRVVADHPNRFTHLAVMAPFPYLLTGDAYPKNAINDPSFVRPPNVMVMTGDLDFIVQPSWVDAAITNPLRAKKATVAGSKDVRHCMVTQGGNHFGFCDSASFFGMQEPEGGDAEVKADKLAADTQNESEDFKKSWAAFLRILRTRAGSYSAVMSGITFPVCVAADQFNRSAAAGNFGWELIWGPASAVGVAVVALELYWMLYFAPKIQRPGVKAKLAEFFLGSSKTAQAPVKHMRCE